MQACRQALPTGGRHSYSIVNSLSAPAGESNRLATPRAAHADMLTVVCTRTNATGFLHFRPGLHPFASQNTFRPGLCGLDGAVAWLPGPMTVSTATVTVLRLLRLIPPRHAQQPARGSADDGPSANTITSTAVALVERGARIGIFAGNVRERRRPLIEGSEGRPRPVAAGRESTKLSPVDLRNAQHLNLRSKLARLRRYAPQRGDREICSQQRCSLPRS